nr:MAG TPA: hypothetical protein [Caudoviricetes sp.]
MPLFAPFSYIAGFINLLITTVYADCSLQYMTFTKNT